MSEYAYKGEVDAFVETLTKHMETQGNNNEIVKENIGKNEQDIMSNSDGLFDIAEFADENSNAIFELAECIAELEERIAELEGR